MQPAVERAEHLIMERLGPAMQRIELKGSAQVGASAERRDDLGSREYFRRLTLPDV